MSRFIDLARGLEYYGLTAAVAATDLGFARAEAAAEGEEAAETVQQVVAAGEKIAVGREAGCYYGAIGFDMRPDVAVG